MAGKRDRLSGNEAIAIALRQINPDVFPAFPITPSTEIPQYFASFVANGQVDTEFIPVESEHSSMSAAIGASAAGARSLTATSSCGLAYMWEELYIAASNRLPLALVHSPVWKSFEVPAPATIIPSVRSCHFVLTPNLLISVAIILPPSVPSQEPSCYRR